MPSEAWYPETVKLLSVPDKPLALDRAVKYGYVRLLRWLIPQVHIYRNILVEAVHYENLEIFRILDMIILPEVEIRVDALRQAVQSGNNQIVEYLLNLGLELNQSTRERLFIMAIAKGQLLTFQILESAWTNPKEICLAHAAVENQPDFMSYFLNKFETSQEQLDGLLDVVLFKNLEMAEMLLKKGAKLHRLIPGYLWTADLKDLLDDYLE